MTINGKNYSSPRNINLKDGILRFGATNTSTPFDSTSNGLYVNSSNELIFYSQGSSTTLGASGGGSTAPTWEAIIQGDQSMQIGALGSFTIDRNSGNNDVLTITNTGAGSGDCIQITNAGSGNDIEGTSDTWHFSKAGDMTANMAVFAGDAGSTSLTLTAGDILISDGSITLTDADNAASLSITNDSATSASMVVIAGAGTFTGSTTTSFMTITPSGLTTGTGIYFPLAAMTTGTGMHIVCDTVTSGKVLHIQSGVTGTTMTANGRLFYIQHTGTGGNSVGALAEITSAVADETVIFKITASGALALGKALSVSATSMTTGNAVDIAGLDALTTGIGINLTSAATAIQGAGRMFYMYHSGATSTSGVLAEFKTAATDETTVVKITTAAMVDGIALNIVGTTGMTTGSLIRATTSTAGAVATNGIYSFKSTGAYTSTSNCGLVDIGATATTEGTVVHITSSAAGQTTAELLNVTASGYTTGYTGNVATFVGCSTTGAGNVVNITAVNTTAGGALNITNNALTTGYGAYVNHTTAVIANGGSLVRVKSTSIDTSTTTGVLLDLQSTASTAGTQVLGTFSALTTGVGVSVVVDALTTGTGVSITNASGVMTTTGEMLLVTANAATTCTGIVRISGTGLTDGFAMEVTGGGANATATGGVVNIAAGASTAGNALKIVSTGVYAGTGMAIITANSATTGVGIALSMTGQTSGTGLSITGGGANLLAAGELVYLNMGAATDGAAINIVTTGVYTGAGVLSITANSATTGTIAAISATSLSTGTALSITTNTTATGLYLNCYDGANTDFSVGRYGATIIAGNASGTASLTQTNGDHVITSGHLELTNGSIKAGAQAIENANTAIDITHTLTTIANNGASTHTLADGAAGQIKIITCTTYTGDAVITPANFVGSTITLNAAGDTWMGIFSGTEWRTISLGGTAAVA